MPNTFAKTVTAQPLKRDQMRLRIETPRHPHTKPHKNGGNIVLMRYVADITPPMYHHRHAQDSCQMRISGCSK